MLALENPHCGVSGVPFINSTTGADPTALSIAALVSVERKRTAMGENRGDENLEANVGARAAWRNACITYHQHIFGQGVEDLRLADDNSGLEIILTVTTCGSSSAIEMMS
jgi:hypothetical protein